MRRVLLLCLIGIFGSVLLSTAASAGTRNPSDFPLRVHIFQFNGYSHYYRGGTSIDSLETVDGEGRADLFENSHARGFDFSYSCQKRLMVSPGYETYIARWKKQDRVLEVLLPEMGGKPGETYSCELKVSMKESTVYVRHNGLIGEEQSADFKKWMDAHQYDPEHGKNAPLNLPATQADDGIATPVRNGNSINSQP